MELLNFITENAIILIPVLVILGQIMKNTQKIPDKWIPLLLLPLGLSGAMALGGWNIESALQGILVTGTAVYSNQVVKQLKKTEE